jgi:hypothetical protein
MRVSCCSIQAWPRSELLFVVSFERRVNPNPTVVQDTDIPQNKNKWSNAKPTKHRSNADQVVIPTLGRFQEVKLRDKHTRIDMRIQNVRSYPGSCSHVCGTEMRY